MQTQELEKDEYHRHATAAKNIRRIRNPAVGKKVGKGSLRNWAADRCYEKNLGNDMKDYKTTSRDANICKCKLQ